MVLKENYDRVLRHKHALLFVGGIAAAVVGKKIIESDIVKEATTNAVASVMAVKKDAEDLAEEIRQDAEAIAFEEDEEEIEEKVEIEVEEVEEKPKKTTKKSTKKSKKSKK